MRRFAPVSRCFPAFQRVYPKNHSRLCMCMASLEQVEPLKRHTSKTVAFLDLPWNIYHRLARLSHMLFLVDHDGTGSLLSKVATISRLNPSDIDFVNRNNSIGSDTAWSNCAHRPHLSALLCDCEMVNEALSESHVSSLGFFYRFDPKPPCRSIAISDQWSEHFERLHELYK